MDDGTIDRETWRRITFHDRAARLAAHVRRHYRESIRLEDAACIAGMEVTAFSRWFRRKVGMGFPSFLTAYRVHLAIKVMRERDASIAEIAESVGFRSRATFQRAFLKVTGHTPARFRRRVSPSPAEGVARRSDGSTILSS